MKLLSPPRFACFKQSRPASHPFVSTQAKCSMTDMTTILNNITYMLRHQLNSVADGLRMAVSMLLPNTLLLIMCCVMDCLPE